MKKGKKVVVITGASSGIGRDTALYLAENGFEVIAGVRKAADREAYSGQPRIRPVFLDVTSEDSVRQAQAELKPFLADASEVSLVNNAGIAVGGPVETVPISRWREQFEVNVFGLLRVTQAWLPDIRRTRGRVVNVSSVSGLAAAPYLGPYAASKFAVEAISDALRRELRQCGVKVIVLEPGPIDTPIWGKSMKDREEILAQMSEEQANLYRREIEVFVASVQEAASQAVPVRKVSVEILRSLAAPRPRPRCVVGSSAVALQAKLLPYLPDGWIDAMIARQFTKPTVAHRGRTRR
jgi:NAD(P)-dependent dehydrogenase (short-subunit alcohol dehydrogenase family)